MDRLAFARVNVKLERMKILFALSVLLVSSPWLAAQTNLTAHQEQILAATASGIAPRFNGVQVISIHPNTPLIFRFAVSGGCGLVAENCNSCVTEPASIF